MPAESRQKPLSFNRTEKNELFQSTGRTLFYLKHWGQLTTDSSVLDIVKGYRRRFKARPHQFYRPITNPKSSKKFQAIKTESEFSSLKRCNKADSQVSSKICVPSVHCSQHVWRFKTSDKPEASTSISAFANIQDLRSLRFESYLRAQRLYDHDRSVRQLYDSSYRGRVKKLSVFSISRSNISIQHPSIWSQRCPKSIYKNSETSSRKFKISRLQDGTVPRRHYSRCICKGTLYLPGSDSAKNFRKPGFCHKSGKIKSGTFSSCSFSRLYCGLKKMSFSLPHSKIQSIILSA